MFDLPLTGWESTLLIGGSFLGSLMTATAGVGGGSLLIAIMAAVLPPAAIVPVHGLVQLGSNGFRFALTRKHAHLPSLIPFWLGALGAFVLGLWILPSFQFEWVPLIIAIFIIAMSWVPIPKLNLLNSKIGMLTGGTVTTYISLFVGATGPLVAAWIGLPSNDKLKYTAHFSACMSAQHLLKIILFILIGFQFFEWIMLVITMIGASFIGTKLGLHFLKRIESDLFKLLFKGLLTLLSINLIVNFIQS